MTALGLVADAVEVGRAPDKGKGEDGAMTDVSHAAGAARTKPRQADLWEFKALVAATYPLFLVAAIAARVAGGRGRSEDGRPRRSVFAEAHAAAAASLACAFMG